MNDEPCNYDCDACEGPCWIVACEERDGNAESNGRLVADKDAGGDEKIEIPERYSSW